MLNLQRSSDVSQIRLIGVVQEAEQSRRRVLSSRGANGEPHDRSPDSNRQTGRREPTQQKYLLAGHLKGLVRTDQTCHRNRSLRLPSLPTGLTYTRLTRRPEINVLLVDHRMDIARIYRRCRP